MLWAALPCDLVPVGAHAPCSGGGTQACSLGCGPSVNPVWPILSAPQKHPRRCARHPRRAGMDVHDALRGHCVAEYSGFKRPCAPGGDGRAH